MSSAKYYTSMSIASSDDDQNAFARSQKAEMGGEKAKLSTFATADTEKLESIPPPPPPSRQYSRKKSVDDEEDTYAPANDRFLVQVDWEVENSYRAIATPSGESHDNRWRSGKGESYGEDLDLNDALERRLRKSAGEVSDSSRCTYVSAGPNNGESSSDHFAFSSISAHRSSYGTEASFAERFYVMETDYLKDLKALEKMVEILEASASDEVLLAAVEGSKYEQCMKSIDLKLDNLRSAINGMHELAIIFQQNIEAAMNEWKSSEGPLQFIHIYCTRGHALKLYPSAWCTTIESVLDDLKESKSSTDLNFVLLFNTIKLVTGKDCIELLQSPAAHLGKYRSKLESYVDFLEEPAQLAQYGATDEYSNAVGALKLITDIIEAEDTSAATEALSQLTEIVRNSPIRTNLFEPSRKLRLHGAFTAGDKEYSAYLFNDVLLLLQLSKPKKGGEKLKHFEELTDWTVINHLGATFELTAKPSKKKYIFTASSEKDCREWLGALSEVKEALVASRLASIHFEKAGNDRWVPDEQRSSCTSCTRQFTAKFRRHHCRHCGEIFCGKCTPETAWIKYHGQSQRSRTCLSCFAEYLELTSGNGRISQHRQSVGELTMMPKMVKRSISLRNFSTDSTRMSQTATLVDYRSVCAVNNSRQTLPPQQWLTGQLHIDKRRLYISQNGNVALSIALKEIMLLPAQRLTNSADDTRILRLILDGGDNENKGAEEAKDSVVQESSLIEIRMLNNYLCDSWRKTIADELHQLKLRRVH